MAGFKVDGTNSIIGMQNSKISVKGRNNTDTSTSRAGQIFREIRMMRQDFDIAKREWLNSLNAKNKQSPYAQDRQFIDPDKLHRSQNERNWKQVDTRKQELQEAQRRQQLKKLNII